MNKELLLQIKEAIETTPSRFEMGHFYDQDLEYCETTMCIAGWACHLAGIDLRKLNGNDNIQDKALEVLELERDCNALCEHNLFYVGNWPEDLKEEFYDAEFDRNGVKQVEVACKVIDSFIEAEEKGDYWGYEYDWDSW